MASFNTIAKANNLPGAAQGASSTSEFQFLNASGGKAEFTVPAGKLSSRKFRIVAGGRVTGGTTTNFTVTLYAGTTLGTSLYSSGAKAVNSTSGAFLIDSVLIVDTTGKLIIGNANGGINASLVAGAIATAANQDPATALTFSISGTFSASNSGNKAFLDFFEIEVM